MASFAGYVKSPLPRQDDTRKVPVPGPASKTLQGRRNRRMLISTVPQQHNTYVEGQIPPVVKQPKPNTSLRPVSYASAVTRHASEMRSPQVIDLEDDDDDINIIENLVPRCQNPVVVPRNLYRTVCLFCLQTINIKESDRQTGTPKSQENSRILKNLCYQWHSGREDRIPEHCSKELFPFCDECEQRIYSLWESQKIIHEAQKTLSKTIAKIERIVVDAEILNTSTNPVTHESIAPSYPQNQYVDLRNVVLESYRRKLLAKKGKRSATESWRSPPFNCGTSVRVSNDYNVTDTDDKSDQSPNCSAQDTRRSLNMNKNYLTVDDDLQNVQVATESTCDDFSNLQSENVDYDINAEETVDVDQEQISSSQRSSELIENNEGGIIGTYNENNCTLVITEVRGHNRGILPKVTVKQEIMSPIRRQASEGKKSRRLLFEGIEICKVVGSQPNSKYLQCSACNLSVPITRQFQNGKSPFQVIKSHIKNAHKRKVTTRAVALKKQIKLGVASKQKRQNQDTQTCRVCRQTFNDMKTLQEHQKMHMRPSYGVIECDICGRPVKGTSHNLDIHKFSHKNDDERKVALAAGERGARRTMLANIFTAKTPKKKNTTRSSRDHPSFARKSTFNNESNNSPTCHFCNRSFSRNCYLALHLKSHTKRQELTQPVPSSSTACKPGSGLPDLPADNRTYSHSQLIDVSGIKTNNEQ